jgi:hypothetical protein
VVTATITETSEPAERVSRRGAAEPRWLRVVAFVPAAALAAFGGVGLSFAVIGEYRPLLVFPLGALAFAALVVVAKPLLAEPTPRGRRDQIVAAVAVVFVVAIGAWHVDNRSEHVLINRDGGSYATTGRWLASHGNLTVDPRVGPFADEPSLRFSSFAVYDSDGELTFQFAHGLPVILAQAHRIGGDDLMFAVPGLLAAAALLSLFVAAWRFTRNGLVALAAVVAFAFVIPEISFSRDTYSEIPSQVLLFTVLWILIDARCLERARAALVAGLLLGALQMIRIDAFALMLGVPVLFAVAACRADANRRRVLVAAGACFAGAVPGVVIGYADLRLRSASYYADLSDEVRQLVFALFAAVVVSAAAIVVVTWARRSVAQPTRALTVRYGSAVAAVAVVVGGLAAWIVRPRVQHMRGVEIPFVAGLQTAAGAPVDATRLYFERSMQWMSWYLGPVTVVAAIIAAGVLALLLLRGHERAAVAVPALLGPASALYLWKASAVPDHVWVMRRFLLCAIPLLVLLAYWLVAWLLRRPVRRGPGRAAAVIAAAVVVVIGIAAPARSMVGIRNMSEQSGYATVIRDACGIMGRDAAVVVLPDSVGIVHEWIPQSLRSWCDVPVATLPKEAEDRAETVERLAAEWAAEGRTLHVVSGIPATITDLLPGAQVSSTRVAADPHFLERTLLRRPDKYTPGSFALAVAPVEPVPAS